MSCRLWHVPSASRVQPQKMSDHWFLYNVQYPYLYCNSTKALSLSFDSPAALIFTLTTNLLLALLINCYQLHAGKFTSNIKTPSSMLSHNRCYELQPLLTAPNIFIFTFVPSKKSQDQFEILLKISYHVSKM